MAGELVASVVVDGLLSKLRSGLWSELGLLWNFNDDFQDMKSTLQSIGAVLNHAEKKSFNDEPVRLWLKRLKAAAYDMEDMLDELPTHNRLLYFPIMAHKLKAVRKRLDKIAEERSKYNLIKDEEAISYEKEVNEKRKTTSVVFKDDVLGRDQEAAEIINRLLMSTTTNESTALSVIPIVGIGGLGKTTLAKLIYNDDTIKEVFEPRIWVHAVNLEVEKLVEAILSSSEAENRNNLGDWDSKMKRAKEILQGNRYLIVLDDVWSEDWQKWDAFKQILQCGGKRESKIIITTRSDRVPSIMGAGRTHLLKPLSDNDCLKLFEQRAFGSADAKDNHLASIGEEIVKKCRGVPLAANSLGGMLHFEKGEAAWRKVRDSDLWELKEQEGSGSSSKNKILPSLKLSYHDLPSTLKLCFIYCSSYPKASFKLDKDMLIQQWIAQRFIQKEDEVEALQIGDRYVNHLLSISFLEEEEEEIAGYGCRVVKSYMKMHDLVYDLARWVAGDEVSVLDAMESGADKVMECRYASVIKSNGQSKELGKALPQKVRALHFQKFTSSLPKGIFSYTKCLRVLDFTSCSLDKLPTSIYKLKQLRYLRLPDHLTEVDEQIGKLGTLESLIIPNNTAIYTLPTSIGKLHNLIYLQISYATQLSEIPYSIGSLKKLNNLKLVGCKRLRSLPESTGELHNLIDLDLSFSVKLLELPDSIAGLQKLNSLKLFGCQNLGSLPESLGNFTELRTVDIRRCAMLDQDEFPEAICKHLKIQRDEPLELFEFDTSDLMLHLIKRRRGGGHVVRHVTDAKRINLKERGGSIKSLTYHCGDYHKKGRLVEAMLEALQPHQNLQELHIDDYGGSIFPSWMMSQMESFLPNLVKITLMGIKNCEHLPVLGQLPKLEEMVISCMRKLRIISEETACASFPSLKRLELSWMWGLEELVTTAMAGDDGERGASLFPCLDELIICRCPKLRRIHPCITPSLKKLELRDMDELEEWVTAAMAGDDGERGASLFPWLEELTIRHCSKLRIWVCIPSLRRLSLIYQDHLALQPHQNLQELRIDDYEGSMFPSWMMSQMESFLPNLVKITLEHISNCEHLPVLGQLPKLEEIVIKNMPKIRRISEEELCGARNTTTGASFPSLKRLELRDMWKLEEWVTAAMAGGDGERGLRGASIFPCLEDLTIYDCPKLRRIHPGDDGERGESLYPCLEDLTIQMCHKLRRIRLCISPSVRRLSLSGMNLLHLPTFLDVPEMPLLKHLEIYQNDLDIFPESIRRLTSLETLELRGCFSLITFPEWLGELSQLQHLEIEECPLINRLPQSIQRLTALKRLRITGCSESLLERTRQETGEDWDKISHIGEIEITSKDLYWDSSED